MPRDQVFISYSHQDKNWLERLQTHLKPGLRGGAITSWSDEQIAPGSKWFAEIKSALAQTKVAVLLVTPDFLASDFIHEHELGPLLKEAERGRVTILWVPIYASAYKQTALEKYQAVLDPNKPLGSLSKAKRDEAWVKICEEIEKAVRNEGNVASVQLSPNAAIVDDYLRALREYAGEVRVPGLDISSTPIPIDKIFIEPRLVASETTKHPQNAEEKLEHPEPSAPELASAILAREQSLVLLGEPGRGKSTLLRQYAWKMACNPDRRRLPLLVELGRKPDRTHVTGVDFAWLNERLPELLKNTLGEDGWGNLCTDIKLGNASVLLDGFDELGHEAQRQARELICALKGNQIVLTSRPREYGLAPLAEFKAYDLLELTPAQTENLARVAIETLARQYGGVDYQVPLQRLLEICHGPAGLMARNPLLLSFMCLTAISRFANKAQVKLPTHPVPLIRECVEALVAWQREHKVPSSWPHSLIGAEVIRILAPMALTTFKVGSGGGLITAAAVQELSTKDKQKFFGYLVPGYFVIRTGVDYLFPSDTFRAFFAAQAVARTADPFAEVRDNLHNPKWEEMIIYTAGSLERIAASKIDLALPTISYLFVKFISPLLKFIASTIGIVNRPAEPMLKELSEFAQSRRGTLEKWLAHSRCSTEYFVTSVLRHQCHYERLLRRDWWMAVRCLQASPACPDGLGHRLASVRPRNQREKVLLVSHMGVASEHQEIREVLVKLTQADGDSSVREAAVKALSGVASEHQEIREVLVKLTRADEDHSVREAAVEALSGVAVDPLAQTCLLDLLRGQHGHRAMLALKKVASSPSVWEPLLQLTGDSDKWLRRRAVEALAGAVSETHVQKRLLELTWDNDVDMRGEAVKALAGAVSQIRVQERLLELTRDNDVDMRVKAVEALAGAVSETRVQERLLELARDNDVDGVKSYWLLVKLTFALRKMVSAPSARDRLLELTRHSHSEVCRAALQALEEAAADPQVQDHLLRMTHRDPYIAGAAVEALEKVASDPQVRERLLELMPPQEGIDPYYVFGTDIHDQIFIRGPAVRALMRVPPGPTINSRMLDLMFDPAPVLRNEAVQWLFWAAPSEPSVQRRLLELTQFNLSRFSYVRGAAAAALGAIASEPSVRTRLLELTYDYDPAVCRVAANALEGATSDAAVRKRLLELTHGFSHPNSCLSVRTAAARALGGLAKEAVTREILRRVARIAKGDASLLDTLYILVQRYEEFHVTDRFKTGQ